MAAPRFYCPDLNTTAGAVVRLPPVAAHHAVRVLRLREGEPVVLFNGAGRAWQGKITDIGRDVDVQIVADAVSCPEPALQLTLVQSLPSGDKMDWIVQKAVELGVHAIQPVAAKRGVVKLSGERAAKRVAHWQEVAVAACEQCGRDTLPAVLPILELGNYLAASRNSGGTKLLLAPGGKGRFRELTPDAASCTLLVGPEGGFENEEIRAAQQVGFELKTLGPRILRTETAGLASLAAIMALWGDG